MEFETLGEYRYLLDRKKRVTLLERIKYNSIIISFRENKLLWAISIIFCSGLIFAVINAVNLNSKPNSKKLSNQIESEDTIFIPTGEYLTEFLAAWEDGKRTLSEMIKIYSAFDAIDASKTWENMTETDILADCSLILEHVKRKLKKKENICLSLDGLPEECKRIVFKPINCSSTSRYRNIDGSCNNLEHPKWGMSGAASLRWLKAVFNDDISEYRKSVFGVPLPNARYLSYTLFSRKTKPSANITMLFPFFGLFLDHDIIEAWQPTADLNKCCELADPKMYHPACKNIEVPLEDPFYGTRDTVCIGFLRDTPTIGTCPGRREHSNQMTSFIDASDIYGNTKEKISELRSHKNGLLRILKHHNTSLLPPIEGNADTCFTAEARHKCFLSGDVRTSMLTSLISLHTMWMREHNRIAKELHRVNPRWNDETLFQEARKIMIAELQLIVYSEFLPMIFDEKTMKLYDLFIDENSTYDGYDNNMDPSIHNAFICAAFRFGHTLIQDYIYFIDEDYNVEKSVPLHETFFNPNELYRGHMDSILRGMLSQNSQQSERYTNQELRGRLFQKYTQNKGSELTAISIERGRDHGLPSYLHWRAFCNLTVPASWDGFYDFMKKDYVDSLKNAYMSIEDIDILPGALGEIPEEENLLGPTYTCLIGLQFQALRRGDRFWFEDLNQPGSFTKRQLKEIYKVSVARFVCDSSDNLKKIQKFPFLPVSEENPLVNCTDIPKMDLSLWKE